MILLNSFRINIIHNKPLGIISWYYIVLIDKKKAVRVSGLAALTK